MSLITWNPNDAGSGSIFSNNNLTVKTLRLRGARATVGKSSGKWYWECEMTVNDITGYCAIVYNKKANLNTTPTETNEWIVGYNRQGILVDKVNMGAILPAYAVGDIIGVALDMDTRKVSFYKNGVFIAEVDIKITDTVLYAGCGSGGSSGNGGAYTANFGATSFEYPIPKGYLPYDYENAEWFFSKYLIQDDNKIKKPTMEGLEEIGDAPATVEMFELHGTDYLPNIIGNYNKDINMIYKEDLEDMKLFRYKLVGYSDITKLSNKVGD